MPIYRGSQLVGGIGVSGDGIDQDDMISFLGLHEGGLRAGGIGNADPAIRADQIEVDLGNALVRLRYVNCPFAPFLDTSAQNVCQGKSEASVQLSAPLSQLVAAMGGDAP